MNQYQLLNKLGQGAFSVVYKVKRKEDGLQYAMKKVRVMNLSEKQLSNCLNEVRILASIQNDNILAYRDSFYDQLTKTFCIVTDFLDGGDLAHFISRAKNIKKPINEKVIWDVAYQTLKGLKSLHDAKVLHRDIKSANIFMNKDHKQIKLGDMNVSIVSNSGMARTQTGTPYYASPQVWNEKPYSSKCDIWSLGCVLYEMATFRPPFVCNDMRSLKRMIMSGVVKRISTTYSDELWNFIKKCLRVDPKDRPSAQDLLKNTNFNIAQNFEEEKISFKLLDKIQVPRKRQFRMIKDRLPKHRFSCQKNLNSSCYLSDKEKDKQNITIDSQMTNSTKITKPSKLPELKRPTSATNRSLTGNQIKRSVNQCQVIEPKERPPLPLPKNRNLRA